MLPASLLRLLVKARWATCLLLGVGSGLTAGRAHAQSWQQAVVASGQYRVGATAADSAGNVYVAGYVSGTAKFGTTVLTCNASSASNAFVAKWSKATSDFAWALLANGAGSGEAQALAVVGRRVYVGGYVSGPASFGNQSVTGGGFIARVTDAGTSASFAWAQQAGSDKVYALAVANASVYLAGTISGSQNRFGSINLASAGSSDVFVARLRDAEVIPSFAWAQRGGGTGAEVAYALAAQGSSVYLTGYFYGPSTTFGSTMLTNSVASPALYDVFIAKLTDAGSSGAFAWAQQAGGAGSDIGKAIAVSGSSVYVAGEFQGPAAQFGPLTLTASASNDLDIFMVKLTDAGATSSFGWVQAVGGVGYDTPAALVGTGAAVYVAGYFQSAALTLGSTTLTRAGGGDIFVAKLLDGGGSGRWAWGQRAGGTGGAGYNFTSGLAVLGANVYVAGSLAPPTTFGSQTVTGPSGSLIGYWAALLDAEVTLAAAAPRADATLALYPNPAAAAAHVWLPAGAGALPATLSLLDALGRPVRTQLLLPGPTGYAADVSLQGLAAGLYRVQVQAGSQRTTRLLAVE